MGGVEDDNEPASKRIKISSGVLRGLSNGSSCIEPISVSSIDLMARPLPSEGGEEILGSKGVIKRHEFVRIIAEALYSLGYEKSGARLEDESGINLHSSLVSEFMQQILNGQWDECVVTLQKIGITDDSVVKSASLLILEQKFFELLDQEKIMDALKTLRTEITPLQIKHNRIRALASCIISPCLSVPLGLPSRNSSDIARAKSRTKLLEELQKLLPAAVMIPERRLEHLVEQALALQCTACTFHNSVDKEMSLYTDHQCGKDQIPSQTLQILQAHTNEVWFLQFSHSGRHLASSSSDRTAIIWEADEKGSFSLKHQLTGHQKPVCSVSWSRDDRQLLTCGVEETVRRWNVSTGECLHVYEKTGHGREFDCWKGQRTLKISDLEITNDGRQIISICKETGILLLDWETRAEKVIEESQTITSFSLSEDSRFLLINLLNQEIHLWSIQGEYKLITKYKGHKRTRFVIRSCFGGLDQAFIASGSEDSQVYVWHKSTGDLIGVLPGHSGAVNCVSWNPKNHHMLASASDDRTIRIWGLNNLSTRHKNSHSNGNHSCNGGT
ncbi:hypothetical protein MLD38_007310 [Melastoma candidum]|uniref:Uncharacterized protein n=1 Tax=Melastoma candidum TaxID=119954 RepID=A0ACB9RR91_9MYRT|nr:hypothetical protein MLD38_007310 [Melastoma candidum]